jgi:hypothetical protein
MFHCETVAARQMHGNAVRPTSKGQTMNGTLTVVVLTLTLSGAALADTANTQAKAATTFGYLDIDKDARISPQEAKADWAVAQRFAQADADHDGYLDADEFRTLTR